MDKKISAKRYEPPPIDLGNKNSSQTLSIESIGYNKKVLEIGTSTGYVSKILKELGNNVTGIEIDPEAAVIAQHYCDQIIIGDVEDLDFSNAFDPLSFDVILCGDILEHLKNPATLLKKVKKYLKPEGYLVVSLPNFCHGDVLLNILIGDFHYTSKGLLDETHLHFFSLKNIYTIFAECGYEIKNLHTTNLNVGDTELKVNLEKIPPTLLKFICSLPNSDVYQFIFTAHPSAEVTIPTFSEPDINKLVINSLEDSIQEIRSSLLKATEKNLTIEPELTRVRDALLINDNHINNLEAIIRAKDTHIQTIENEIRGFHEAISAKENRIRKLETDFLGLHDKYSKSIWELENLSKEIEKKEKHILNVEELLRISQRGFLEKVSDKCFITLQKYSPSGTKRRRLLEVFREAITTYSNEGLLILTFHLKSKIENVLLSRYTKYKTPIIATDINHLPGDIPFSLEKELSGIFICPTDGLDEVWFFSATYRRKNAGLDFQIQEYEKENQNENIIRTVKIQNFEIRDNNWTRIRFVPIQDSKGKTFKFSIKSRGSPAAAIWLNPEQTYRQLQLFDENGPITGSIGFQCFSNSKVLDLYELWINNHEPSKKQLEQIKMENLKFSFLPKISIITPVWNVDEKWLRLAIESVKNQVYPNWELCLTDGGSTKTHIRQVLNEYAAKDSRIKVKFLGENKGIACNSNEAIALATGDFVGFLDHDDEILPFTLYEVVKKINQNPDVQLIYSDEDKIDESGKRENPFFKPDWSPDLFLSQNYLCHFSVIRKTLIDSVGGFREGYDGSQDYDLFLRVTEKIPASAIIHIPKILYHWRSIQGSAANLTNAKPYAFISAKKALQDALKRREIDGIAEEGLFSSSYRIHYSIFNNPKISIIIPTKDKFKILQRCIESILKKTSYKNYEIVIVDNQSIHKDTFDYYEQIKDDMRIRIISYNYPFNFSAINNYAVSQVTSPYVLFLNNDTEVVSEEWLSAMLEHAQRKNVGAVGAKLLYPDSTIQHAGIIFGLTGTPRQKGVAGHLQKLCPDTNPGYFLRPHIIGNTSGVTAACMLMKKEIFSSIGGFDERLAIAFNDVDLCLKLREKGYLIVYTPYAKLFHYESLSRGYEDTPEKQKRFKQEIHTIRERWGEIIDKGDPYYNENLTIESEDFSIRW